MSATRKPHYPAKKKYRSNPVHSSPIRETIDELIAAEKAAERNQKMPAEVNAKIRTIETKTGFPVEFDVVDTSPESIMLICEFLIKTGYKPAVFERSPKPNADGKKGVVLSVAKHETQANRWVAIIRLDGGTEEVKIVVFDARALRKNDRVRLEKNEKGYLTAVLLDDSEDDKGSDNIPF